MSRELVRLTGDEEWDAWGDDWWRHVNKIADLQLFAPESYYGPPEWMRQHQRRQLDWGATLYEASKDDVVRLLMEAARPDYTGISEGYDRPFRELATRQDQLLRSLADDGRYGVIWVEQP
jgi:hypothetical protein